VIQEVFSAAPKHGLTVAERIAAVNSGFQRASEPPEVVWRLVGAAATLALIGALTAWIVALTRRRRWIGHHLRSLAAAGLHDEELRLFARIAARAPRERLPLLTRQPTAFDAAAAETVRRDPDPAGRRTLLASLLALRRRVPFDRAAARPPEFPPGLALQVCMRLGDDAPVRLDARVSHVLPQALQLSLAAGEEAVEVAPLLRAGQEVVLVVRRGPVLEEARVRIRGRSDDLVPQLLVDRPTALAPARVRIAWSAADERVAVELLERFSASLVRDDAPRVEARVVATSSEGLLLRFASTRPRHGETIRVVDGARAGVYHGYAQIETRGNGGDVFVLRRIAERAGAAAAEGSPREEELHGSVAGV